MAATLAQSALGNGVFEVAVGFDDLVLDRVSIVSVLGYCDRDLPEPFGDMLDEALGEARKRCELRAGYRLVDSSREADRQDALRLGGAIFTTQKIVASALASASQAALFVGTIGSSFETWTKSALHGTDPALGYIADTVGSAVTEALADRLHDHIEQESARQTWKVTNRYSPGYCNWSVAEQALLFALLPPQFCGISLSESALMHPIKSVSGIIGVGPVAKYSDYLCDVCNQRDCTYRLHHERKRTGRSTTTTS